MPEAIEDYCDPNLREHCRAEARRVLSTPDFKDWPLLSFPRIGGDEPGGVAFCISKHDTYDGLQFLAYPRAKGYLDCSEHILVTGVLYTTGTYRRAMLHAALDVWADRAQSVASLEAGEKA